MESGGANVQYRIDGNDRISAVNDAWSEFARSNSGDHLLPPGILGHSLWRSIVDPTTVQVYRLLLARVRDGTAPVSFRFRCDAPDTRRLFEMHLTSATGGAIDFETRLLESHPRPHVSLLDVTIPHYGALVTICAWCMRVRSLDETWVDIESAIPSIGLFETSKTPQLSHGICPSCYDVMMGVVQKA